MSVNINNYRSHRTTKETEIKKFHPRENQTQSDFHQINILVLIVSV